MYRGLSWGRHRRGGGEGKQLDSLEVSHFQLHCTIQLCFSHFRMPKVTLPPSLCPLTFSSFSRMGLPPKHSPGDTGSYSSNTITSALYQAPGHDSKLQPGNTAGPIPTRGWPLGTRVPPNSTRHLTGECSSIGQEVSSSVVPDKCSLMGSCCNHTLST